MMSKEASNYEQIDVIERKIKDVFEELEQLTKKKVIMKNAGDMEAIEEKIIRATGRLAGLITAQKIQQSLDSEELKAEASELISSLPQKMKNQGQREVEITPSRGEPIKIKAPYYSRKKKKRKKKR
jgi:antitoxin component YwqK of YwqJK toxin-antitoxin module